MVTHTPLSILPVEEKINVFVPLVFSLDYSRNVSSIISYLSTRRAFSFQTDAKKTTPVRRWRPSALCTKDLFHVRRIILYRTSVALRELNSTAELTALQTSAHGHWLWRFDEWLQFHWGSHGNNEREGRSTLAFHRLCMAGLQTLILSFAALWSRVAQPM